MARAIKDMPRIISSATLLASTLKLAIIAPGANNIIVPKKANNAAWILKTKVKLIIPPLLFKKFQYTIQELYRAQFNLKKPIN